MGTSGESWSCQTNRNVALLWKIHVATRMSAHRHADPARSPTAAFYTHHEAKAMSADISNGETVLLDPP